MKTSYKCYTIYKNLTKNIGNNLLGKYLANLNMKIPFHLPRKVMDCSKYPMKDHYPHAREQFPSANNKI